jgi:[acyl-carrier-protein] S-malonyltransferase
MGQFLYDNFASAQQLFTEASDAVSVDFKQLCFEGSAEDLALTKNTQPALLLVSTCTFVALNEISEVPVKAAAGHSIGEYAALVTAGTLKFSDAVKAVRARGEAMQSAVPVGEGGMVAVMGLEPDQVKQLCAWAEEKSGHAPVEPANFNAPGQIVISGDQRALHWLHENFTSEIFNPAPRRAKLIPLNVSAPFHCSLMKPAEETMRQVLNDLNFAPAKWPIIQNVNAQGSTDPETLRQNIIAQVSAPVRWVECVQQLRQEGIDRLIEFGGGKVLAGLVKKIDNDRLATFNINSLDELKQLEKELNS